MNALYQKGAMPMPDINREIQELLDDYAHALRDGCIPVFLKSLSRKEAHRIAESQDFWDAAEVARSLNNAAFADKASTPDLGLFASRVDAKIASRLKRTRASTRHKRALAGPATRTQRTQKHI